jgi:hypothetical protein
MTIPRLLFICNNSHMCSESLYNLLFVILGESLVNFIVKVDNPIRQRGRKWVNRVTVTTVLIQLSIV